MFDRKWYNYCKTLGLNPRCPNVKNSEYYQEGFTQWKVLQKSFYYYSYMSNNT
jgi:hypothetical protein